MARDGLLNFDLDGCVDWFMVDQPHARIVAAEEGQGALTLVLHVPSHSYWWQVGTPRATATATYQVWQIDNPEAIDKYRQWRDHEYDPGRSANRPTFRADAKLLVEYPTRGAEAVAVPPIRNGKPSHLHRFT